MTITFLECDNGTYGLNCVKNCSGQCLNNSPCNKQTGKCNKGCNPGYTNGDCSKGKITNESYTFCFFKPLYFNVWKV